MKKLRLAGLVAAVLLGMLGLHQLVYAFMSRGRAPELPKMGRVPDFAFTSERGRPVAAKDLEEKSGSPTSSSRAAAATAR